LFVVGSLKSPSKHHQPTLPATMKVSVSFLLTFLALTSAQDVLRNINNNNKNIPDRATVLAKLEAALDEKRQMVRDHESGHRRLSNDDYAGVQRIIGRHETKIQKYMEISEEEFNRGVNNKREARRTRDSARMMEARSNNEPPKPQRVPAETKTYTGLLSPDEARRRKMEEKKKVAEERKAERIEQLERILRERQDKLVAHREGHRLLSAEEVQETEANISKIGQKLQWAKNAPAEDLLPRSSSHNKNGQQESQKKRRASNEPPPPTWKSSDLSFMEAMNEPQRRDTRNNNNNDVNRSVGREKQKRDPVVMDALVNRLRPMIEDHKAGRTLMDDRTFQKATNQVEDYDRMFKEQATE
jgi:hypothetical protein